MVKNTTGNIRVFRSGNERNDHCSSDDDTPSTSGPEWPGHNYSAVKGTGNDAPCLITHSAIKAYVEVEV
jgi:hypothetical protein